MTGNEKVVRTCATCRYVLESAHGPHCDECSLEGDGCNWEPGEATPEPLRCACCRFDDDSSFSLTSFAGGAAKEGLYGSVTCEHRRPDGTVELIHYMRAPSPAAREEIDRLTREVEIAELSLSSTLAQAADESARADTAESALAASREREEGLRAAAKRIVSKLLGELHLNRRKVREAYELALGMLSPSTGAAQCPEGAPRCSCQAPMDPDPLAPSASAAPAVIPFTEERRAVVNGEELRGGEVPLPSATTPEALARHVEAMVCSFLGWPGNRGMSDAELIYRVALGALRRMRDLAECARDLTSTGEGTA